jgi:phosphohistidine phosphatase
VSIRLRFRRFYLRTLLLVRHAKSSWVDPSLADRDRPLNGRGLRCARRMGRRLAKRGLARAAERPDLVLTSPAVRALKTARLIARRLNYRRRDIAVQEALYETTAAGLLRTVRSLDERYGRVMLVGHNPEITLLARRFDAAIAHMPTCAVACFRFDVQSWAEVSRASVKRMTFDYPRKPED